MDRRGLIKLAALGGGIVFASSLHLDTLGAVVERGAVEDVRADGAHLLLAERHAQPQARRPSAVVHRPVHVDVLHPGHGAALRDDALEEGARGGALAALLGREADDRIREAAEAIARLVRS